MSEAATPTDLSKIPTLASQIVAAYVAHNRLSTDDLPGLIERVHRALASAGGGAKSPPENQEPAVPVKKSVFADHIVCLEDGKKLKMLKRHLQTAYGMTPQQYREKWGLPHDYPMVAPDYASLRSELARQIGLGRKATAEVKRIPEGKRGVRRSKIA